MPSVFWNWESPVAIAHRGGNAAGQNRRNTMAAFKAANRLGYKYIETDVICSKDKQVIVAHGALFNLTARLRGTFKLDLLQNLTYKQIKSGLDVNGEQIPLLKELVLSFPRAKFFIDPKSDEAVEPLARLVKKLKLEDRVCLGSFNYERIKRLYELLGGKGNYALIIGRNNWLRYLPRLKTERLTHVQAIYLHHSFVSRPMIRLIHNHGFKVLVWTCNSPLSIKHALRSGADGIMSDRIDLLKDILVSNKEN